MFRVMFTGQVDQRFAWLGNDAEGGVDLLAELLALIDSATTSVEVSSMTFNFTPGEGGASATVQAIADKLAEKAQLGVAVRIVGNGGHRFQAGYLQAMRGPVQLFDQGLAALVKRVSFQTAAAAAPAGWLVDHGALYAARGGGESYGWDQDVSAAVLAHNPGAIPASFTSPLLREAYAAQNSAGTRTWSILLQPNSWYAVRVFAGLAAEATRNNIKAQNQSIFSRPDGAGNWVFYYYDDSNAGDFSVSTVDGGTGPNGTAATRRVQTGADGRLNIQVGYSSLTGKSALAAVEIYAWSAESEAGDDFSDPHLVQKDGIHHSKFVIVDGTRLWCGSHNLTPVDPADAQVRSEDAIYTDDAALVGAFRQEFNSWWGGAGPLPNPATARSQVFKTPVVVDASVANPLLGDSFPWRVRFSPSTNNPPGVDLAETVQNPINAATQDILLLLEQLTMSGDANYGYGLYDGATDLVNALNARGAAGVMVQGLLGNDAESWPALGGAGVNVTQSDRTHNKVALFDVLRDNPTVRLGKVIAGSMNWSKSGMHANNEQTLVIEDPGIANLYLQRAAAAFSEESNPLGRNADCIVVIDRSGSMNATLEDGTSLIAAARLAAKVFLDVLEQDGSHRVALVRFGRQVEPFVPPSVLTPLTAAQATTLDAAIDTINADGPISSATCYGAALNEAWGQLTAPATPQPRRLVLFLTDGKENREPYADSIWPTLAANGVELHTTSFGLPSEDPTGPNAILHEMALGSGGSFAQVPADELALKKRFADVARDAQDLTTLLDPAWQLAPGESADVEVAVDVVRGVLLFVWLWPGRQPGLDEVELVTPAGVHLTAASPAVRVKSRPGQLVWRVDLGALGALGGRRGVQGVWKAHARASRKQQEPLRLELSVYGPSLMAGGGVGHLQAELHAQDGRPLLRVRGWAGNKVVPAASIAVTWRPPAREGGEPGKRLTLAAVRAKVGAWRGVSQTPIEALPGTHTLHLLLEGSVKGARGEPEVRFRREQTLHFVVGKEGFAARVPKLAAYRKRPRGC